MSDAKLRAWWSHRQGLDGRLEGESAPTALAQTGWARSMGGAAPYLTLFARAGISREAADAAAAKLEIHEVPAARGCTYVVPADDFALALKAGQSFAGADLKVAYKLGVTDKEIGKLCEAVMKALEKGALDPEEIREATGNASRNLVRRARRRASRPRFRWPSGNCKRSAKSGACPSTAGSTNSATSTRFGDRIHFVDSRCPLRKSRRISRGGTFHGSARLHSLSSNGSRRWA